VEGKTILQSRQFVGQVKYVEVLNTLIEGMA